MGKKISLDEIISLTSELLIDGMKKFLSLLFVNFTFLDIHFIFSLIYFFLYNNNYTK